MANFENIRRYAEFSHEAGLDGGIDNHLENIKNAARTEGALEERSNFGKYIGMIVIATVGLWECGKRILYFIKAFIDRRRAEKVEALKVKAEESEATIRTGVNAADELKAEEQIAEKGMEE